MKRLLLLFFLIPFIGLAQDHPASKLPFVDGKIVYERITDIQNASKSDLYGASKKWVAKTFNNPKYVTKESLEDSGFILGSGIAKIPLIKGNLNLKYSFEISIKDNKTRIRINDFMFFIPIDERNTIEPLEKFYNVNNKLAPKYYDRVEQDINRINNYFYSIIGDYAIHIKNTINDDF